VKYIFTKHAKIKFANLAKIGVTISKKDILGTVKNPQHLDKISDFPKIIASKTIDEIHILRVVFKSEDDIITIITFYPAKRGRYYEN